jgi:hypothetical protein
MVKLIELDDGKTLNVARVAIVGPLREGFSWVEVLVCGGRVQVSLNDRQRIIEALKKMEAVHFGHMSIEGLSVKLAKGAEET